MTTPLGDKSGWLEANGTLNPRARWVNDALFQTQPFFDPNDLLQVKYEMLRRTRLDGWSVTQAAAAFGFSRPTFYQAQQAFSQHGLAGLLADKRGPRTAHKLTAAVMASIQQWLSEEPRLSSRALAQRLATQSGVSVHPRSIERALQRQGLKKSRHGR
jgi:transposase